MSSCIKRLPAAVAGAVITTTILGEPVQHGQHFWALESSPGATMSTRSVSYMSGVFQLFRLVGFKFIVLKNLPKPCDNACKYKDKYIPLGSSFLPRSTDPCRRGTCTLEQGRYEVKFKHERCSICPKDCIQQPRPGQCCPTCECGPVQPEYCPPLKECPFLSCPLKDQYTPYQKCCPICDYCVDQWGKETYDNQKQWWYYDQKCTCNKGHIECVTPPFSGFQVLLKFISIYRLI